MTKEVLGGTDESFLWVEAGKYKYNGQQVSVRGNDGDNGHHAAGGIS